MTEIDKAIDELIQQMADIKSEIARREHELTAVMAEMRGLERAKILFTPPESAGRLDVQGPVMAVLENRANAHVKSWNEGDIIATVTGRHTDIPGSSIHKFLLRASRTGKLVCQDGVYSLPPKALAAE